MTVADSYWIIVTGLRGYVGLATEFLTLLLPVIFAGPVLRKIKPRTNKQLYVALPLLVTYVFDLLANGLFNVVPYFLAGALLTLNRRSLLELKRQAPGPMRPIPRVRPSKACPLDPARHRRSPRACGSNVDPSLCQPWQGSAHLYLPVFLK